MNITGRRYGQDTSENIIDPILSFDDSLSVSVTGTGAASRDLDKPFNGVASLKLENNAPTNDLVVSESTQGTSIPRSSTYKFSCYIQKEDALEPITLEVQIFVDNSLFIAEDFVIGNTNSEYDKNNVWQRFQSRDLSLAKGNVVTFLFTLKGNPTTGLSSVNIWLDGLMLNDENRDSVIAPIYTPPTKTGVPDIPTVDGNYQLTITGGVPTWTIIT